MDSRHLTREMLMDVYRSDWPSGRPGLLAIAHVCSLCPECRAEFEAWRELVASAPEEATDYSRALSNAVERVRVQLPHLAAENQGAEARMEELTALPLASLPDAIEAGGTRFRGTLLAELLVEESRKRLPGRPRESYTFAQLAQRVLEHSSSSLLANELYARAVAYAANALRAQGELRRASEVFGHARFLFNAGGTTDILVQAELDWLEGALRRDQRRLPEAKNLLKRAVDSFRMESRKTDEARALLTLGMVHREQGDFARAIELAKQALALIDLNRNAELHLFASHNLACWLADAGQYQAARSLALSNCVAYDAASDPVIHLRRAWLESRIARGLGQTEIAEETLDNVRQGFLKEGNAYDAALVSLELATMYLEQGRTREVKALAEKMVPAFEAQEVHRESLAALILFRDAAQSEEITLAFLGELASYLERARLDPAQPFRHP